MKMSEKDLNSLMKPSKKKARTYYDRLDEAVTTGFNFKNDSIVLNENSMVLNFSGVYLLSHNDILRIQFKKMYRYISLWKERVGNLIEDVSLKEWEKNKIKKIKIEFLYTTQNKQCLDYDSTVGAVKFVIDGLTESSVIFDDSIEFIPVVLSRQKKTRGENALMVVLTPIEEEEYENYFSEEFKKHF
jgi:hypothetical protein